MNKTTLYLPDDLKEGVKRIAAERGVSEAEIIRHAIREEVGRTRPKPRGSLFSSDELIAERVDELLEGFGEDDR